MKINEALLDRWVERVAVAALASFLSPEARAQAVEHMRPWAKKDLEFLQARILKGVREQLLSEKAQLAAITAFNEAKADPEWNWDTPAHVIDALRAATEAAFSQSSESP